MKVFSFTGPATEVDHDMGLRKQSGFITLKLYNLKI